ncbi:hypothetical protein GCM10011588_46040 [Nocardia jinanensis]|uniref:Uncharacterized protein n=1 Tax=Nocardia jinanensis TaxID=382504 RepID=A0A917VWX1_9NOCA|nr:hypothetical protein GCM10011588_46040 [Nocardia jinanensis]
MYSAQRNKGPRGTLPEPLRGAADAGLSDLAVTMPLCTVSVRTATPTVRAPSPDRVVRYARSGDRLW